MKTSILFLCFITMANTPQAISQKLNLLIGTYTNSGKSEGIYVYEFDPATGKSAYKNKVTGTKCTGGYGIFE